MLMLLLASKRLPTEGEVPVVEVFAVIRILAAPLVVSNPRDDFAAVLRVVIIHCSRHELTSDSRGNLEEVRIDFALVERLLRLVLQETRLFRQKRQLRTRRRIALDGRHSLLVSGHDGQQTLGAVVVLGGERRALVGKDDTSVGSLGLRDALVDRVLRLRLQELHLLCQEVQLGVRGVVALDRVGGLIADGEHAK